jgi:hypothetical protein
MGTTGRGIRYGYKLGDYHADDLKQMKVSSWTVPQLVKAIISELDGQDFVLILDHLDRITVASSEWLRELAESDDTVIRIKLR